MEKDKKDAIRTNSGVLGWHMSGLWVCKVCVKSSTYLWESYRKDVLGVLDSVETESSEQARRIGQRL